MISSTRPRGGEAAGVVKILAGEGGAVQGWIWPARVVDHVESARCPYHNLFQTQLYINVFGRSQNAAVVYCFGFLYRPLGCIYFLADVTCGCLALLAVAPPPLSSAGVHCLRWVSHRRRHDGGGVLHVGQGGPRDAGVQQRGLADGIVTCARSQTEAVRGGVAWHTSNMIFGVPSST